MFEEAELRFDRSEREFEKFECQLGPETGVVHAVQFARAAKSPSVSGEKPSREKWCPVFSNIEEYVG
jgi:hypothetical protein